MNDSIICFTLGLSQQNIQSGISAFQAVDQNSTRLNVTPFSKK